MDKFARLRRGYGGQAAELKLAHGTIVRFTPEYRK
jgi:hypothetical protein